MKNLIMLSMCIALFNAADAQSNNGTKNTIRENPVLIGQQRGLNLTKSQLALDPVLRMPKESKDYVITGYQISYLPKDGGREIQGPFVIKGNEMNTGATADILNKVQPGDRIYFEDIVAVSADPTKKPMKLSAAVSIE